MKTAKTKKKANLPDLVETFGRENSELLATLNLFEVSNAQYERALQALTVPSTITTSSTGEAVNAVVESNQG